MGPLNRKRTFRNVQRGNKIPGKTITQIKPSIEGSYCSIRASLIVQLVKIMLAMRETPVRFLGQEDPLEKGSATHSSILGLPLWLSW